MPSISRINKKLKAIVHQSIFAITTIQETGSRPDGPGPIQLASSKKEDPSYGGPQANKPAPHPTKLPRSRLQRQAVAAYECY